MKIGIYISDILLRKGGTEANCAYIIYALQKIYNFPQITVLSEKYKNIAIEILDVCEHLNATFGINIKNININLLLLFADKANIFKRSLFEHRLKKASKVFDLFFNCSMNLFAFSAKKNIVIIHFPPYPKRKSMFVKKFPLAYFIALIRDKTFFKSYLLYITYSQYVRYWLHRIWGIDNDRAVLFDPAVKLITRTIEPKTNFIFVCSRIEKSKDIDILITAYQSSDFLQKTYKLIIAGSVIKETKTYVSSLKNMIGDMTDLIILHENPSHGEITDYYNKATIFWHAKGYSVDEKTDPSDLEHFGLTTVEAMSAGCVPVVINKGGQKEIVDNGVNGYRWDTPEELVEKTIYLIQHDDERKKMADCAIERANNYSLDKFTQNLGSALSRFAI
jgi:glycosyltransferase involved in cell wall biosynthesis